MSLVNIFNGLLFPREPLTVIRVSLPASTERSVYLDYAVIIGDPARWRRLLGLPTLEERVRLHRESTLGIMEGTEDPSPMDPGERVSKLLKENPSISYELHLLGDAKRMYERRCDSSQEGCEPGMTKNKAMAAKTKGKGKKRQETESGSDFSSDNRFQAVMRVLKQLLPGERKNKSESQSQESANPSLRDVVLQGLCEEDALELASVWPETEPVYVARTRRRENRPRVDEVRSATNLIKCSAGRFRSTMEDLDDVVWEDLFVTVRNARRTIPVRVTRSPKTVTVLLWGDEAGGKSLVTLTKKTRSSLPPPVPRKEPAKEDSKRRPPWR